jgi:hypothetical protein
MPVADQKYRVAIAGASEHTGALKGIRILHVRYSVQSMGNDYAYRDAQHCPYAVSAPSPAETRQCSTPLLSSADAEAKRAPHDNINYTIPKRLNLPVLLLHVTATAMPEIQ